MSQKIVLNLVIFTAACVLCFFNLFSLVAGRSYNNGLIFYDLKTFQPYLPPTVSVSRGRNLASVKFSEKGSIWSTFGKPCECQKNLCGCCAGIKVKQYNFDQKMCANVTFVPPKEEAQLEVFLNERPSSKYGISVRNPSPFCIPVMMGIPMAMCVQMSDIAIQGNNLNMCMDFIVRLATTDLFEMHFQCMQMGLDGFQYIDKNGNPVIPPSNTRDYDSNEDDYYDYETDENEISYGTINEKPNKESNIVAQQQQQQQQEYELPHENQYEQQDHAQQATIALNGYDDNEMPASAVHLQQQMHQLQSVQQTVYENETENDDKSTTLAPIFVQDEDEDEDENETQTETETETDIIAPITAANDKDKTDYETMKEPETTTAINIAPPEIETTTSTTTTTTVAAAVTVETPATTEETLSTVTETNESNETTEIPTTLATITTTTTTEPPGFIEFSLKTDKLDTSSITLTNEKPVSMPIVPPNNIYTDATISTVSENIINGNTSEMVDANYASDANSTITNIDFEPTTIFADVIPTIEAFIAAPVDPTAAIVNEASTIKSDIYVDASTEKNQAMTTSQQSSTNERVAAPKVEKFTMATLTTVPTLPTLLAANLIDNEDAAISTDDTPALNTDALYPTYRRFYG